MRACFPVLLYFLAASPLLFASNRNCRLSLLESHAILAQRLESDTRLRNQPKSPFTLVEEPRAIFNEGGLLKRLLEDSHAGIPNQLRPLVQVAAPMQPLARALNERLFVVQDYVLYKTDRYKAALAASYGIEPVELEMGLKKWVDDRLQKAVGLINRTSIAQEKQLEEAEAELTAVVSDLEALSRRDKFRDELVARYGQYINRERSLVGLRKIEIITGYTLAGKKIPEAPTNPRTVQNLVPTNWRPWWVEKDRTSGDYVEIPDFSNPMNLGPGRILEEGEEFSPLEGPSLRELHELAPSAYQIIEEPDPH